ncbi:tyrosine-type recombinase/integrase [Deinococcus sp.]|uniref:tyrosine-type recombinase/integrase n=1 Tax=Deinococcus sp. TaxID=47478 RepID=UPI003CC636BD
MARKKSANGDGTLSKRKDKNGKHNGWKGAVVVGYKADGTLDRRWVSGTTQQETQDKRDKLKAELRLGLVSDTKGITMGQFLDQWMEHKRVSLKPKSIEDYSWVIEHRLKPTLERLPLEKLKVLDIERMMRKVREETSPNAAKRARTVLRMALEQAVKWQMVPRNLADIVDVPKIEKKEMQVWEPGQVTRFLALVQLHRLSAFFHLALTTGMRCGELQALRWADIDWEKSTLQVRLTANEIRGHITFNTPKSRASRRTIHLSPSTMETLTAHRKRQAQERQALEGGWKESGLVFASDVGTPLSNANLRRLLILQSAKAELPTIRLHDMRHTAATAMIRRGYTAKLVADILGHTDPGFTLREYAHIWDEQRREFAPSAADLYGSPSQPAVLH